MREIRFYRMESGHCPIEEFLDSLSAKPAQKTAWVLQLIEELDVIPSQYFKKLVNTDDIWEIRIQLGGNIFRILGFLDGEHLVILNHAFQKKTQKTPRNEIKIAENRKRDYFRRKQAT
jgi:phage-related protein